MTGKEKNGVLLISIIIVNWNGRAFLEVSLASVFAQSFTDFEVIVVDNGSTDGSVEFMEKEYPEARVVRNDVNRGFALANNQGIEIARGKYVLTLNNDTELKEGFLEELAGAAEASDEDVGMWATKILSMEDHSVIDSVGGLLIYPDGLAKGRGRLDRDSGQFDATDALIPSACAGLYRKRMLDLVGAFDADFFAYCEDTDLGLRARLAGWKARAVPGAVVYHHYSGTSGRYTPFKAYLVERNHLFVALKNLPLAYLLRFPFYTSWRYMVQAYGIFTGSGAGGRFVEGSSKMSLVFILVKAYAHALAALPAILAKRSRVQRLRTVSGSEVRGWFKDYGLSARELVLKD